MSITQVASKIKSVSSRQKYPTDDTIRLHKYVCDFEGCNKSYGKKSHLTCHWRTHTGERPFGCECGKRFTRSDELARHRRTHTGERKYTCPYCAKRFIRSDHMTKHAKRHPEFNLNEFLTARQALGYATEPEPSALDMSSSSPKAGEEVPKRVIFLPNNDDNKTSELM